MAKIEISHESNNSTPVSMDEEEKNDVKSMTDPVTEHALLMDWERGLVGWESETDPSNPLNWTSWKKGYLMLMIAIISTLSPMASTLVSPGLTDTMNDFHTTSPIIGTFMITIYVLGFAVGPLFLGPASEMYGRYPVVISSTLFFNIWLLGSALAPTMGSLITMRLLAGIGGSGVMTVAPAIVADMYVVEKRAFATSVIVLAQCAGPAVGPLIGAFVIQAMGWRWAYWVLLMSASTTTAFLTIFMNESYAPVLLRRKKTKISKETGRDDLKTHLDRNVSKKQYVISSLLRPLKLLTTSPIAFLMCTYLAIIYGILYLWFTTIPTTFINTYKWQTKWTGLAYLGLGLGMVFGLLIVMKTNDPTVMKLMKKNGGVYEPEMRLPVVIWYAGLVPVSVFWYGWSVQEQTHWIVPIIGSSLFGAGTLGIFVPVQQYLVDAFFPYSASAVAATRTSLSIVGTFLPTAGPPLFNSLGLGVGNSVLGVIAVLLTPIPWLFYRYGGDIRRKYPVNLG
ncbi:MFS general substrate transporter [Tothia fuscella]|uniref:MFS general substrate transporter n=1 Tax=Tothia fuscella TaxID=1048955 RepID=A0A9P4TS50_9PEZI|nr:MFS general substrate transporter [Tothia fuscella]